MAGFTRGWTTICCAIFSRIIGYFRTSVTLFGWGLNFILKSAPSRRTVFWDDQPNILRVLDFNYPNMQPVFRALRNSLKQPPEYSISWRCVHSRQSRPSRSSPPPPPSSPLKREHPSMIESNFFGRWNQEFDIRSSGSFFISRIIGISKQVVKIFWLCRRQH